MSFQVISNPSFVDPSEQAKFYAFFVSSLATICFGFIAAGRDGLLFDTRVIRGLHRLSRYGFALFFFLYSIFLSISQWIINSDNQLCFESFHFDNETHQVIVATDCKQILKSINILYLIIILIDPLYLFFFLYQPDYRSPETFADKLKVRLQQRRGFVFSFLLLFAKLGLLIARFVMILVSGNVGAIILSAMNLMLIVFNFFVHIRCLMLYSHVIKVHTALPVADTTNPVSFKRRNTSSDDDHHIPQKVDDDHDSLTDDDDDDGDTSQASLLRSQPNKSRPPQKIKL